MLLAKICAVVGVCGDYRREFWHFAAMAVRAGRIEELIGVALVAHHMIRFARECTEGRQKASFYVDRPESANEPAAA